jgi:Fe-S-cluster containining protein
MTKHHCSGVTPSRRAVNPCTTCGACCAQFRVSFYWSESDAHPGGRVPAAFTVAVTPHRLAMRGTEGRSPRCAALEGEVGEPVRCTIYEQRPTPCR